MTSVGDRPFITLSWAQSLDGSLAARRGERSGISGPASLEATHRLRSEHDAILVGVGTLLADDPRLDVRLVAGRNPQPIVLDAFLRTPTDCALLRREDLKPLIVASTGADASARRRLEEGGAVLLSASCDGAGRLDLNEVLALLAGRGIGRLMVEGGGAVLRSFLRLRLADRIVVTIAPRLLCGYNPFAEAPSDLSPCLLASPRIEVQGGDILVDGSPRWESEA